MLRYRNITKYRSVWMALAALWILYYHSSLPPKYYSSFLGYVRFFGFSGVDIFVFASGLGCYHSLTRHYDPIAFLKKAYHPHSAQLLCCADSLVDLPASSFRYFGFFGICELSVC